MKLSHTKKKPLDKTLDFYSNGAQQYIEQTKHLEMTPLNNFMLKHFKDLNQDSTILDLGFGSGREMDFLETKSLKTVGIDMTPEFVTSMEEQGKEVYLSKLPQIKIPQKEVDAAYSIAVIFHLTQKERLKLFLNLNKLIKQNGKLILSYNTEDRRTDKNRFFDKLSKEELKKDLEKYGFELVEQETMDDKLNRGWQWVTDCYQLTNKK